MRANERNAKRDQSKDKRGRGLEDWGIAGELIDKVVQKHRGSIYIEVPSMQMYTRYRLHMQFLISIFRVGKGTILFPSWLPHICLRFWGINQSWIALFFSFHLCLTDLFKSPVCRYTMQSLISIIDIVNPLASVPWAA